MERKAASPSAHQASRASSVKGLDYFPTPPWATRALMQHVMPAAGLGGQRFASAWDPACGAGHIAEVLADYADIVIASDVHDYGYGTAPVDFIADELDPTFVADWIVTNPPFAKKATAFMVRARERAKVGVAMFLQLRYLEGIDRYNDVYRDNPPTLVAFFVERVPLHEGRYEPDGDTATAYVWLVWIKDAAPLPPVWIPPGCRQALTEPDDAVRFTAHPVTKRPRQKIDAATGEVLAA